MGILVYRIKLFLIFTLLIVADVYSQKIEIKSLKAFVDKETELPVLISSDKLNIMFDIKSDYEPNLIIVFRFCDRNWKPYQNIFLLNYGKNI
jgi:hypothetical protein